MKILRKFRYIVLLIACLLTITSCGATVTPNTESSGQTQQDTQQTNHETSEREQREEQSETQHGELLFQDERVSIYAADKKAYTVTMVYGDYTQRLEEFNSLRPHCTTWETDADCDGTNELYLIHTFGSGTGVSVQKLFVFEPNGDGLDVYCHDSKEIQAQFNASCSGSYDPKQQTLQMSYGESSYTCDVSEFYNRDYIATATNLVLISGHIIEYSSTGNDTVRLSFNLSFESDSITSLSSYLPEDAAVSCLIRFSGTGFDIVEDLKFTNAPEYPWMIPEFTSIGYEEFFAHDRAYYDPDTPWFGYGYARNSAWFAGDGEARALYGLRSDEEGFYIHEDGHKQTLCYRIPNTADLVDCSALITNTRQLYCAVDGTLLRVDVLTGKRDTLYTADYVPDMELCLNDVLYFLAISDGILSLNRLYLPTMTLDVLYTQTASEVPASYYELYAPESSQSVITWETINPLFWKAVEEIMAGPESKYPELHYPTAFTVEYIATHPVNDEAVQHNFALLQDVTGFRPRMKCGYDPVADTYDEKYGIYDICFFGTGVHNGEEHFGYDPEYNNNESQTPLTAEELAYFAEYTKSFWNEGNTPISCFFTSFYDDPRDMNATEFLRYCPDEYTLTWGDEAEFQLVMEQSDWWAGEDITLEEMPVPCHRHSRAYLNEILMRYAGITVEEMHTDWLKELLYVSETDCFYTFTSDCGPGTFIPSYGEKDGDIVTLWGCGNGNDYAVLVLQKSGENWHIISHKLNNT